MKPASEIYKAKEDTTLLSEVTSVKHAKWLDSSLLAEFTGTKNDILFQSNMV